MTEQREHRELHVRAAVNEQERTVTGLGVPYGETITVWGERERLAPGSVEAEGCKLFSRHRDPIGVVTEQRDDATGWHPTARFSSGPTADEAYALARDGVLDGLSIGFDPIEWHVERDELGDVIVYDRVRVREVSLVPFPAYPSARVESVRHDPGTIRTREETPMPNENENERADDLRELRESVEDLGRRVDLGAQRGAEPAPVADARSGGAWLRALVAGDADSVREYEGLVERAYAGGTSADGLLTPQYVGDTIRLIEAPNVLGDIFATGTLPEKGLKLEYGVLATDDVDVDEQLNEGDDLTTGKITLDTDYATIHTYGGAVELSRQKIERTTNVNVLDLHLRALSLRAGRRKAAVLRKHYADAVAARLAAGAGVVVADETNYLGWVYGIIDAAETFQDMGLSLDALVADKATFKNLAGLVDKSGRPLMVITGTGDNTVGSISPKSLGGDIAGVSVRLNLKQSAPGAAFVNGEAIRQYNSPLVELSDENIINLSKQFGVYYYGANATEIPGAIVPVRAAAAQ